MKRGEDGASAVWAGHHQRFRARDGRTKPLAYTTVMTVMSRLADKGALRRRPQGRSYVYEATAADSAGLAVRGVLRDFGDAAMAQFVEEARSDPKLLERLFDLPGFALREDGRVVPAG